MASGTTLRPTYSVLNLEDMTELIGPQRHWRDALAECVNTLAPQTAVSTATH